MSSVPGNIRGAEIPAHNEQRDVVLVTGKTGFGKSAWTHQALRGEPRVLILDPVDEYREFPVYEDMAVLIERIQKYRTFRARVTSVEDFPILCQIAMGAGDCVLVIDEAQRVVPPQPAPPEWFQHIVYRGRHERVSLIVVTQRPTTVHLVARSQWTRIVAFAQTEDADVKYMESQIGRGVDLEHLRPLEYWECTPWTRTRKRLRLPKRLDTLSRGSDRLSPESEIVNDDEGVSDDESSASVENGHHHDRVRPGDDLRPQSFRGHPVNRSTSAELDA